MWEYRIALIIETIKFTIALSYRLMKISNVQLSICCAYLFDTKVTITHINLPPHNIQR